MNHIADNHDALLDYLYEEGDPAERLTIAKHLQECARVLGCGARVPERARDAERLDAAGVAARVPHGAGCTQHEPSRATARARARCWPRRVASWRLASAAAAAVLLFVAGMAVSQLSMDYDDGALTVQLRQPTPCRARPNVRDASIALPPRASPARQCRRRERRDRRDAVGGRAEYASVDTEQLLQRVRAMIDQSEQRQQRELALRLSQVAREVDTQHQADLLRIQQNFGQQQEATMDYLVRTSGGVK